MHELDAERGLVVAREGNEITVLTPAGEWHTLRWAGRLPEVGEEVMLPPIRKSLPWKAVTAGVALILLLFLALPLARHALIPSGSGIPAYYISIDINPSIELVVDRQEKVIDVRGLNGDGEKLLAGVALKDEKAAVAIQILTREAVRQGYYLPDRQGAMMVTVIPAAGEDGTELAAGEELGRKLSQEARHVLQQAHIQAVVEATVVQPEIRQHAEASGLSAGRYSILLEALDAGLPLTATDLQKEGLARALQKYDSNWKQLLERLGQDKDLLQKEKRLGVALKKALGQLPQAGDDGGQAGQPENSAGNQNQAGQGKDGAAPADKGKPDKGGNKGGNQPETPGQGDGPPGQKNRPVPEGVNPADRSAPETPPEDIIRQRKDPPEVKVSPAAEKALKQQEHPAVGTRGRGTGPDPGDKKSLPGEKMLGK